MLDLNLLSYHKYLRIRGKEVFDPVRGKWLVLQPEELVRQLLVQYLTLEKQYPMSLLRVEMSLTVNRNPRRCDLLAFNRKASPFLLVECKAPDVKLTEKVARQIGAYNLELKVPYLLITNGQVSICLGLDDRGRSWRLEPGIPAFPSGE